MFERVKEHRDRPEAFAALKEVLNGSEFFLSRALSIDEDEQYFTEIELTALQTMINDTKVRTIWNPFRNNELLNKLLVLKKFVIEILVK